MRLVDLKNRIEERFGKDAWIDLEPETIKFELGLSDLDFDKLNILFVMEKNPLLFYKDALFLLHCVDVLNGNVADFEHMPIPTSLELAWAIKELEDASGAHLNFSSIVKHTVTYILREEGYTTPTPFFERFIEEGVLPGGEEVGDKAKAIRLYLEGMTNGISN